jgi:hypothetical protein
MAGIVQALDGGAANLAYLKNATAVGTSGLNVPSNAVNGSYVTGNGNNWYATGTANSTTSPRLLIDLGAVYKIKRFKVLTTSNWGNTFATCSVYVSNSTSDAAADISLFRLAGYLSGLVNGTLSSSSLGQTAEGRYVMLTNFSVSGPAIAEIEIYSSEGPL